MLRHPIGKIFAAIFGLILVAVWWILELAFGHLLYTAVFGRMEADWGIEDAQVMATVAQYLVPLIAVGLLAFIAYAAGRSHAHQSTIGGGTSELSTSWLTRKRAASTIPRRIEPVLPRSVDLVVPHEPKANRIYTNRSPEYLLGLYVGKTALQADLDMEPYKGLWLKTSGVIAHLGGSGLGPVCMISRGMETSVHHVECHFSSEWIMPLRRYNKGEVLNVEGKISPGQQGHQLYLEECEVLND